MNSNREIKRAESSQPEVEDFGGVSLDELLNSVQTSDAELNTDGEVEHHVPYEIEWTQLNELIERATEDRKTDSQLDQDFTAFIENSALDYLMTKYTLFYRTPFSFTNVIKKIFSPAIDKGYGESEYVSAADRLAGRLFQYKDLANQKYQLEYLERAVSGLKRILKHYQPNGELTVPVALKCVTKYGQIRGLQELHQQSPAAAIYNLIDPDADPFDSNLVSHVLSQEEAESLKAKKRH